MQKPTQTEAKMCILTNKEGEKPRIKEFGFLG